MRIKAPRERFAPTEDELKAWLEDIDAIMASDGLEDAMRALACVTNSRTRLDRASREACRKALDWMQTMKSDLESIRAIEYQTGCADSDGKIVKGTERPMYMVYNRRTVSDEDAMAILDAGHQDTDPRVVSLWPSQALSLFPALGEKSEEDEGKEETGAAPV